MKRLVFIALITIAFQMSATAQEDRVIDSLKNALALTKVDTSRALILVELARNYRFANPDSGLVYAKMAYKLSKEMDFEYGEVRALGYEGLNLVWMGDLPTALRTAFQGLEIAEKYQDQNLSLPLNVIGMVYFELGDYRAARDYFRRGLEVNKDSTKETVFRSAFVLMDLGETFTFLGELDSATFHLKAAIDAFTRSGRTVDPLCYSRLGDIEIRKQNFPKAREYYHKSLRLAKDNNQRRAIAQVCVNLAGLYKQEGTLDSAIYYAKKGMSIASSITQKKNMLAADNLLAEIYEPLDPGVALVYYKQADSIRNSMFGAGNIQAIQALITKEEERQKELREAEQSFNNRLRMNALLGSTFTLAVVAFFLIRNNRQNKKAKKKIESAYDQLKATQSQLIQSEKMASLGELTAGIAHEIQNPLNFVNNFSQVNKELIEELKDAVSKNNQEEITEILQSLSENEDKVTHHGQRADGIVKSMLQHSRSSSGQKELADINALCDEYLKLAYHGMRAKDKSFNAKFETNFDSSLPKINVVPQDIGRVVLNLINNAFYATHEKAKQNISGYEPTVRVSTKNENGKVIISVKDNGSGIPDHIKEKIFQPFFSTKPTGQGTGLGLSLSYDIVKTHGGEITLMSKDGEGSEFSVILPLS